MTPEEIEAWIQKHLASAPERDEAWAERVLATYLGDDAEPVAA